MDGSTLSAVSLLCVSIFVDSPADVALAIGRAARAVADGARIIEWRLDALAEDPDGLIAIKRLLADSPAPCIATIRAEEEGGTWQGDEQTRISILEAIGTGDHPPAYIDLELGAWNRSANLRQKVRLAIDHAAQVRDISTRLILSSHDFGGRPANLISRIADMAATDACAVGKVAYMARSLRDSLEMFDLVAERVKPMIGLCMGEYGLPTRILAPKFGGFLTFAATDDGATTAPGQPTVRDLAETYRFHYIGPRTRVYGVVGHPVGHSLGPRVHNRGFADAGIDAVYLPMPVAPGWESFKATIGECIDHRRLDFGGCSVTLPHKENLLRFGRDVGAEIDPLVARIGAANTLVVDRDADGAVSGLRVLNTDAIAAVESLARGFEPDAATPRPAAEVLKGRRVAVIGAGGVSRAVAAGLLACDAEVVIFNRTRTRSENVVRDLRNHGRISVGRTMDELACGCFHAFVNATPVGMAGGPAPDESVLPDDLAFDDSMVVMDTVYTPRMTPMLAIARDRGARVVDGTAMFVAQAEAQFLAWTGRSPEVGLYCSLMPDR